MIENIFWLIVGVGLALWAIRDLRRSNAALKALFADCDASEALFNWRLANPDYYIGDWPYARELVMRRIAAYRHFLETHSFVEDRGFTEYLFSLLDEHGPPPPAKGKPVPVSPRKTGADFISSSSEA